MRTNQQRPKLTEYVAVCLTCNHWQCDVRAGALSDLGGWHPAMMAIGQAHVDHIVSECPGAGGRINFNGVWCDPPTMESGNQADGVMALHPLPRWWAAR